MPKSPRLLQVVLAVAVLVLASAATQHAFAADCNDGDACTIDAFDPATGLCVYTPITCNDGNPCTRDECVSPVGCRFIPDDSRSCADNFRCTIDRCVQGFCSSTPVVCDDGNPCTGGEFCNPTLGMCMATIFLEGDSCDDGDGCTAGDVCRLGRCSGVPNPGCCDDGNACTTDRSDPATGACVHAPIVCADPFECTDDSCDPASGCVFTPDDSNGCDLPGDCFEHDHCEAGECVGDVTPSCDPDGDGIATPDDQCPDSILDPTVVIPPTAGPPVPPATTIPCDSGVPNVLISDLSNMGCTISDVMAQCEANSATSREFVSCVKFRAKQLQKEHVITDRQRKAIEKCAKRFEKRHVQSGSPGGVAGSDDH